MADHPTGADAAATSDDGYGAPGRDVVVYDKLAAKAKAAETVANAVAEVKNAAASAIVEEVEGVVINAQKILDQAALVKHTRDEALESLGNIMPWMQLDPWVELGSKDYFERRKVNMEAMRESWKPLKEDGNHDPNSKYWGTYASPSQIARLPQEVLVEESVNRHLWQISKLNPREQGEGIADTNRYSWSSYRWSWVSELDKTFSNDGTFTIPDFGFVPVSASDTDTEISINKSWPHGWLTTLETAMAMMGYFIQASDQTFEQLQVSELSKRTASNRYAESYTLFSASDIKDLREGDREKGWKSIMDANHSNLESWAKKDKLPYDPALAPRGDNSPSGFLERSFSEPGVPECTSGIWVINDNWNGAGDGGMSSAMSNHRPRALFLNLGVLQQSIFQSKRTWTQASEDTGAAFRAQPFGGFMKHKGYEALSLKMTKDAELFRGLSESLVAGTEGYRDLLAMLGAELSEADAAVKMSLIVDGDIFIKLSRLLTSLSTSFKNTMDRIEGASMDIWLAHKRVLAQTCDAIRKHTDFQSDDTWGSFADDWDDELGTEVANDLGNPFDNLHETFIANGQTSVMFKEQCFLLSFISDLAISKMRGLDRGGKPASPSTKRLPYYQHKANKNPVENNASLLMDGASYAFLNKLTQNPKLTRFYNALNHELSNLQPKIRLWKVIFDEEGNEEEIEIKFESHFSAADLDMFKSSAARGVGAGLKSFNFVYDGSNPFSVKKSIKANLKIFANSMSEILRDRPGHYSDKDGKRQATTYKYSDLAMKTWNTAEVKGAEETPAGVECLPEFDLQAENTEKAELNFRLKAEVGFSVPLNSMSSMHEDLKEALAESFVTLNLTPTVHNFELDDMGRVTFNLNYLAYVEQFFDQSLFNVFSSGEIALNRMKRQLVMKYYNSIDCSAEQLSQKKEDYASDVKDEQEQAIGSLIADLAKHDLIYYINLPYEKIMKFLSYGPHASYGDFVGDEDIKILSNAGHNEYLQKRVAKAMSNAFEERDGGTGDNAKDNQIQAALLGNDPLEADLSFFYLSDLIDVVLLKIETGLAAALDGIKTLDIKEGAGMITCEAKMSKRKDLLAAQRNLKKLRILLGPMELTHPKSSEGYQSVHVNMGDCPISVKYFVEWLSSKMLQKDEVSYPLTKFVNDLINNLLKNFLNNDQCFGYSVKQKTRLNQSTVTSYSPSDVHDPITLHAIERLNDVDPTAPNPDALGEYNFRVHINNFQNLPILNTSGPSDSARTSIPISNEYNFFIFFAGRVMPSELMKGNKQSDEQNFGIFHYMLGRDRGLIKNIKLTKTQTKGLAEVRFEQEGYQGLEQLRVVYDAQIDMFASVNTFPGTYIYIDPRGFAPEGSGTDEFRLTALGIGGYYMIIRSEHEFAGGKANTILHTKWVNQIDREEGELQSQIVASTTGDGAPMSRKCSIQLKKEPTPEPPSGGFFSLFGL